MEPFTDLINSADLHLLNKLLPAELRVLLQDNAGKLFVAGGWVRDTIGGDTPHDVDIYACNRAVSLMAASLLSKRVHGSKLAETLG